MSTEAKKLIEVALPIKEISAESVRDKSIRHGHISTLHLWWARRPLPVSRAIVFASLMPDPLDPVCPSAFVDALEDQLGRAKNPGDPYAPYEDIPYTAAIDKMPDNLRNRLMMFIAKFSPQFIKNEKEGKSTAAKYKLSDYSLIKWDNKNNPDILKKARCLIFIAHQAAIQKEASYKELLEEFEQLYQALNDKERAYYDLLDRHLPSPKQQQALKEQETALSQFLTKMPKVFDPFAGGGAIPLEAARLGCQSYGNDINPVAHIIQKASLEFPQKYGKRMRYSLSEFEQRYGESGLARAKAEGLLFGEEVELPNRLSFDVRFFAEKMLAQAEAKIGQYYPANEEGQKPIAYYWARTARCSNPSCGAEVPLLRQFYLSRKKGKMIYLQPIIQDKDIQFEIKEGSCQLEGWMERANLSCPCCGAVTPNKQLKLQFKERGIKERLIAVIEEGAQGKAYRLAEKRDLDVWSYLPKDIERPLESMEIGNNRNFNSPGWGIDKYGQMFNQRQLLALQTITEELKTVQEEVEKHFGADYAKAVSTYLGVLLDRIAVASTSFGIWHSGKENLERPFGRQALPMVFDYPESHIFSHSSGSAYNQLDWLTRYIESESDYPFAVGLKNASSGDKDQFPAKFLDVVVTDPPYYDAIAYADLSDFFYVWLKRSLGGLYPENFSTPLTPKSQECTALKHHHDNDKNLAKQHFENKLSEIFAAIEKQTKSIVSIMFAHQSTDAWTTLCNSILQAKMNITGSWPMDSELQGALKTAKSYLASSVTVSARPQRQQPFGDYGTVKENVERTVRAEVDLLYHLGFRGADLLTACFGKAVQEFGQYRTVEKANGDLVEVAELLSMAKDAAFNALLQGFKGDDYSKFYIAWLQLYGFGRTKFDDVAKFSRVGSSLNVQELLQQGILLKESNELYLANYTERIEAQPKLGRNKQTPIIDKVHQGMHLYKSGARGELLRFLSKQAAEAEDPFWRVMAALLELLPKGMEDSKQAEGLLANKENLLKEAQQMPKLGQQNELF